MHKTLVASQEAVYSVHQTVTAAGGKTLVGPRGDVVPIPQRPKMALATLSELPGVYKELSKARLSALVVMTTSAGFLMAGTSSIMWTPFVATCVGTSIAAASANTFNQCWEVENDRLMSRTIGECLGESPDSAAVREPRRPRGRMPARAPAPATHLSKSMPAQPLAAVFQRVAKPHASASLRG